MTYALEGRGRPHRCLEERQAKPHPNHSSLSHPTPQLGREGNLRDTRGGQIPRVRAGGTDSSAEKIIF